MKKFELFFSYFYRENRKIVRTMKLILILLTACFIQVSATVYSQETKFTFDVKNQRIEDVLRQIEDQSKFRFFYQREQIDVERKVTFKVTEQTVDQVLGYLFKGRDVTFDVRHDNLILIKNQNEPYSNSEFWNQPPQEQNTVTGTVTDEQGEPLPGVAIIIKGTTTGTVTNVDGEYSISDLPEGAVLQFSFVGMKTQEVEVAGRINIDVTMAIDVIGLDEVVAIGYGVTRKSDLTGAVVKVDVEELEEIPNVSIMQSMQGTVAGLNVGAVDEAGENPTVSVRGQNTLSSAASDNAPLIVVDGTIYRGSLIDLNTADIESVDILKDASSAAIYGSQASNGVMIINTKKGIVTDKPIISYDGSYTLQAPSNKLEPMNSAEYTEFFPDIYWELGSRIGPDFLQPDPEFSIAPHLKTNEIVSGFNSGVDTDWWGAFTGNGYIIPIILV